MDKDITEQVDFDLPDGECLPLLKCVCGKRFQYWDCIIHMDRDFAHKCDECGRQLYFRNSIRVYEVVDK